MMEIAPALACPLTARGVIGLAGPDRSAFLQGLVSNDLRLCQPQTPLYAALLTPQGKFLHDMFVIHDGERFLLDVEAARAEDFLQRLAAYKLRSKVELFDLRATFEIWALWGWDSAPPPFDADPRVPALGFRACLPKGQAPEDATRVSFDRYDQHRLKLSVPDGSRDLVVGESTLQEGGLDRLNAISWTKGCYIGQELTARMHYRGLAKKRLYAVTLEGAAPESGAPLTLDGGEVGVMRSHNGPCGLALLRVEVGEGGAWQVRGTELCPLK